MKPHRAFVGFFSTLGVQSVAAVSAAAKTFVISSPADCGSSEEFENVANSLQPDDELILKGGVYCRTGRRAIQCGGTASQPIIIRTADGETPVLSRLDDLTQPRS